MSDPLRRTLRSTSPGLPAIDIEPLSAPLAALPVGWVAVAGRHTYSEAASEAAHIDQLPTVERWWAAVWPARAGGE